MPKSSIFLLTGAAFSAAIGQLLFRVGAKGRESLLNFINWHVFLGLCFYGLGTAIWIYALSYEKLVDVYAFTALTFVLVYLGGIFLLGERITVVAMVGIGMILVGLYLITGADGRL